MSKKYFGIDIGGTNTKIGLLDSDFNILAEEKIKTHSKEGARNTFSRIWAKSLEMLKQQNVDLDDIVGIGMGIPGPVVNKSTVVIAANFSWGNNFNAKELMEEISNKPVRVENDVRLIALGEASFGAAKDFKNPVVIPIGTGVSAGIVQNGQVLEGSFGVAGEFGHIPIEEDGIPCGCGLTGCIETYVSAPGIVRYAKKIIDEKQYGLMYEYFKINNLEAHDVFRFYTQGDELSQMVIENFSKKLAYGMGMIINILNPDAIVIAGGVAKSSAIIIPLVKKYLPQYALSISKDIPIIQCSLGDSAGIKGAAALIKDM